MHAATTTTSTAGQDRPLAALDGRTLAATLFEPPGRPRGQVLILGATATPRGYYRAFAQSLAAAGLRTLTFDYRGIGGSRRGPLREEPATMTDWATLDATGALAALRAEGPDLPLVLVGHSFGGQTLGLADALREVEGAFLVGSQLGWYGEWPAHLRPGYAALWHLAIPALLRTHGYVPGWVGLGEDLPPGVAEEWARWCRTPGYLLAHVPGAADRFAAFEAPRWLVRLTDDGFAPEGAVEALAGLLDGPGLRRVTVRPTDVGAARVDHFGFFRRAHATTLWRLAHDFVLDVVAGRAPREPRFGAPPASPRTSSFDLSEEELLADLAFGRG